MFEAMRPEDVVWLTGAGASTIATVVQKCSSKYKPWSWLAQSLGKAINKEMIDKLDTVQTKIVELEEMDKAQNEERYKENALEARRRILRFADECRRKEKHSEEYWNNILEDITAYKDYCEEHPKFENEKAVIAMSLIEGIYKQCYETNDFL